MKSILHKKLYLLIICLTSATCVWSISAVDFNPTALTTEQIILLNEGVKPQSNSYFLFDHYITLSDKSILLDTPYGKNRGYPYKQQLGIALLDTVSIRNWHLGFNYLYNSKGWTKDDFLINADFDSFAQGYSNHMFGALFTLPHSSFLLNGGALYQNRTHQSDVLDTLPIQEWEAYTSIHWKEFYSSCVLLNDVSQCHLGAELQTRPFRSTGFYSYAPDIRLSWFNRSHSPFELRIEQNIYNQNLYLSTTVQFTGPWLQNALLTWYPEKGRFFKFELSSFLDNSEELHIGGEMHLLFVRFAYNHPKEYDTFFGTTNTFNIELLFQIGSANGFFVPKATDVNETRTIKMEDE